MEKDSPEARYAITFWRLIMEQAETISTQYKWILTANAAIVTVIISNVDSIQSIIDSRLLKTALSCLIAGTFAAAISYFISLSSIAGRKASLRAEETLNGTEGKAVVAQFTMSPDELKEELCKPFFGPLASMFKRSFDKGVNDPFYAEKRPLSLMTWQVYVMGSSILLTTTAFSLLIIGLK